MKQTEYDQKKRECWEEYVNMLNCQYATKYVFDKIFDRAYALGKQDKDAKRIETDSGSNIDSSRGNVEGLEQKPAEPKYALSDKVMLNGHGGFEITAVYLDPYTQEYRYCLGGFRCHFCESDLEPYTEPEEYVNLSQNIVDCDKQLDNILKDSFRNERRLNIAAMAMQGILSNPQLLKIAIETYQEEIGIPDIYVAVAKTAKEQADALIAEC